MTDTALPPPLRSTANPAPRRPADSIRRTASIDVSWPDGPDGDRRFHGRARDYLTPPGGGSGRVLDGAWMEATLDREKTIEAISAYPEPSHLQRLVGQRGGNHLRSVLREALPELLTTGAPLYLLLDDISGVALISSWGRSQWDPDWSETMRAGLPEGSLEQAMVARAGVCWGLQLGNSGMDPANHPAHERDAANAGELRNPADIEGWHDFPTIEGPSFRRARRIDVTRDEEAGLIRIDAAFQDSAARPGGARGALHEYRLVATADLDTLELLTLEPEARVLPFSECPGAIGNARRLVGARIADIRQEVLTQLRGPAGCTHLNDALRALAEVPMLAGLLETALAA